MAEKISVDEGMLKEILDENRKKGDQIAELMAAVEELKGNAIPGKPAFSSARTLSRTVRVLFVDDMPFIGFKNQTRNAAKPTWIYYKRNPDDPNGEPLMWIDAYFYGLKEAIPLNMQQFIKEAEERVLKVVKREEEEILLEGEEIEVKEVKGYSMIETGTRKTLTETQSKFTYVVNVDGKDIRLPAEAVNVR